MLAIFVRIDILFSPIGLVFRSVDYARDEIYMYAIVISYCGIIFLFDVIIRSVGIYRELKDEVNWKSKLFTFAFISKACIPVAELIVTIVRLFCISHRELVTNPLPYSIAVFRVVRWFSCADPISFWIGLTKLDLSKRKSITNPINVIINVILLSNLAACVWVFIGSKDLRN